jgi:uncharacterized membrane protein YcaP (DUF421 family)
MKKEEIFFGDWKRLLLGQAPVEFLSEALVRTGLMYVVLMIVLRIFGKRLNVRLTITELAILFTLGSIVSGPMQVPDRGLVIGTILLLIPLLLLRGVNWLAFHYRKVEILTQGTGSTFVKNGILQLDEMRKAGYSRDQVLGLLRMKEIRHLGQVKRAYLEAHGPVSVFKEKEAKPGLSILPEEDKKYHQHESTEQGVYACVNCGTLIREKRPASACTNCRQHKWEPAVSAS